MTRLEQALHDAAWEQFKRMPSSNPSDYVNALIRGPLAAVVEAHKVTDEETE